MDLKELKALVRQIEALEPAAVSEEISNAVEAATNILRRTTKKAVNAERIKKLEAEIKALRDEDDPEVAALSGKKGGKKTESQKDYEVYAVVEVDGKKVELVTGKQGRSQTFIKKQRKFGKPVIPNMRSRAKKILISSQKLMVQASMKQYQTTNRA